MGFNCILIRHGEIGTKGKNRPDFEKCLVQNLKHHLKQLDEEITVSKIYSGYVVENFKDFNKAKKIIENTFGISVFMQAIRVENDLDKIKEAALSLTNENVKSFKIEAKRQNKQFKLNTMEINREVGHFVGDKTKIRAQMRNPDLTIYIDVTDKFTFIYSEKSRGLGGLPVGITGKVVCLLSGGIDSPVAAYLTMKRGCHVTFLSFDSHPFTSLQAKEKIKNLASVLSKYQRSTRAYFTKFTEIQKEIKKNCNERNRTILYRRMMMRIANKLCEHIGAKAIVTGESVGQVASQTLGNLACIEESADFPIIRPLITFDKLEAIDISKQIETYEISIQDFPDSCTVFAPEKPTTNASLSLLKNDESKLDMDALLDKCIENAEIFKAE